ncbi:MAG: sugar MFS transporter [Terracidiphilus sp.]|jgi:FHS family L-fucose permease-like MFS transporter
MATQSKPATASTPNYMVPFIIVTALFGIFGFLTNLNSNLSPKLEDIFNLNHAWSNLVTSSWFFAYLVFSVPAAKVIEKVGYKRTIVISLFIMVAGALLFVPAAGRISFPLFLTASFVLATGVCGLQTSANPYVSILGPEHSAPARLTLAQAFNSLGTALAPIVVGVFILTDPAKVKDQAAIADTVQGPYIAIAGALFLLGIAFIFLHLPAINAPGKASSQENDSAAAGRGVWSCRHTVLAMVGIFLYVGLEIALAANAIKFFETQGSAISDYLRWAQPFAHAVSRFYPQGIREKEIVAVLAFCYPLAMMIGRFAGTVLMKAVKAFKLLATLGVLGVLLLIIGMYTTGHLAIWCLILCGLANSIMYPTIFALGIAELGPLTSKGSGVITLGNVGGAILPPLFGLIADKEGYQHAFLLPIACYLFMIYYGISGYKPTRMTKA